MIASVVAGRGVGWPGAEAMLPAAVAGVMGAACIVIFYLALSYGPVSIVAPVLASSACIPVVYGLTRASGRRRCSSRASRPRSRASSSCRGRTATATRAAAAASRFGVLAAVLLGTLLVIFSRASAEDPYWAPLVLRTFSMGTIITVVLVRRVSVRVDRRAVLVIALIGTLDMLANLAYSVSTTLQLLSITAVLSSLFPVVTVALARIHLGERVTRVQERGAVLTMLGVLAVAAG